MASIAINPAYAQPGDDASWSPRLGELMGGEVVRIEGTELIVRLWHGGICGLDLANLQVQGLVVTADRAVPACQRLAAWDEAPALEALEAFTLANEPPRPRAAEFAGQERRRQGVLFTGLGCLPGQLDLWE